MAERPGPHRQGRGGQPRRRDRAGGRGRSWKKALPATMGARSAWKPCAKNSAASWRGLRAAVGSPWARRGGTASRAVGPSGPRTGQSGRGETLGAPGRFGRRRHRRAGSGECRTPIAFRSEELRALREAGDLIRLRRCPGSPARGRPGQGSVDHADQGSLRVPHPNRGRREGQRGRAGRGPEGRIQAQRRRWTAGTPSARWKRARPT